MAVETDEEARVGEWYVVPGEPDDSMIAIAQNGDAGATNAVRVWCDSDDLATFIVKCLNARDDGSDVADDREG